MRRGCKSCKNNKRGGWNKVGQDAKIVKSLNEIYDEICKRLLNKSEGENNIRDISDISFIREMRMHTQGCRNGFLLEQS